MLRNEVNSPLCTSKFGVQALIRQTIEKNKKISPWLLQVSLRVARHGVLVLLIVLIIPKPGNLYGRSLYIPMSQGRYVNYDKPK